MTSCPLAVVWVLHRMLQAVAVPVDELLGGGRGRGKVEEAADVCGRCGGKTRGGVCEEKLQQLPPSIQYQGQPGCRSS